MSRRLQQYATDEITVTFDPNRCIHAAECIRAQPAVFDPRRMRWIRPELAPADAVADAVARCPTGALQYRRAAGAAEQVPSDVTVRVIPHGPLYVHGPVRVTLDSGDVVTSEHRIALCRCGASATQPFCDNSHLRVRFRDPP